MLGIQLVAPQDRIRDVPTYKTCRSRCENWKFFVLGLFVRWESVEFSFVFERGDDVHFVTVSVLCVCVCVCFHHCKHEAFAARYRS